jgi:hypothetical protein
MRATSPEVLIKVSKPHVPFSADLPVAVRNLLKVCLLDDMSNLARTAALQYRINEKMTNGCRLCPIYDFAKTTKACRICGGLDQSNSTIMSQPDVIPSAKENEVYAIFRYSGPGTLSIKPRHLKYYESSVRTSLLGQVKLLPEASCVLLPELVTT